MYGIVEVFEFRRKCDGERQNNDCCWKLRPVPTVKKKHNLTLLPHILASHNSLSLPSGERNPP